MKLYRVKFFRIPTNAHSPSFSLCPVWGTVSMIQAPSTTHVAKREHFQSRMVLTLAQAAWGQQDTQYRVVPKRMCGPQKRPQMAAMPGFKSQCQSSSAAPFPTSPTIGHSCQHSGQVWPCGVEPIISKLFWTPLQIPIWGLPSWVHPVTILPTPIGYRPPQQAHQ